MPDECEGVRQGGGDDQEEVRQAGDDVSGKELGGAKGKDEGNWLC